jgi:hypothetical protein
MGAGSLLADLRVAARMKVTRAERRSPVRLDRGRTVTKPVALRELEKASSEKQIPQVVENLESGANQKKSLEPVTLRVKERHHFQTLHRLRLIPILTTTWGICFSPKRNPSRVNESSFGTVLPQYDLTVSTRGSTHCNPYRRIVPFCAIQVLPGSGTPGNCCGFSTLI